MSTEAEGDVVEVSEPKYMPGPWWLENRDGRWQIHGAHRGSGSNICIATINHWCDFVYGTASIAAAAPELFEALEKISLMSKDNEHDLFSATQVARAALLKATSPDQGGDDQ